MSSSTRYSLRSSTKQQRRDDDKNSKRQRWDSNDDNNTNNTNNNKPREWAHVKIFNSSIFADGNCLRHDEIVYRVPFEWVANTIAKKRILTIALDSPSIVDTDANSKGNQRFIIRMPHDTDDENLVNKLSARCHAQEHISPKAAYYLSRIHALLVSERPEFSEEKRACDLDSTGKTSNILKKKYRKIAKREINNLDPESFLQLCKMYDNDLFSIFFIPHEATLVLDEQLLDEQLPDLCVYTSNFSVY